MTRIPRLLGAAALLATGVVADRGLSAATPLAATPTASAASAPAASQAVVSGATVDSLTERAFGLASPSVVYISNVGVGSGSGVIYDTHGDIVTNAHVVQGARTLRVTLTTGKTYTARVVGTDTADDLAVIHVDATGLPAARFAPTGAFRVAQTVLAIGSPLGLQQSVTSGLISALGRTVQEGNGAYLPNAIQTSAPINPGNSGGALVTLDGAIVGIPTLQASDPQNNNGGAAQGIGFAVPSPRVTFVARQLIATGRVAHTGRAYLGVDSVDAASVGNAQTAFGSAASADLSGALLRQVTPGSPAEVAGLQTDDVITAANGVAISGQDDLLAALAHAQPGATLTFSVNRQGTMTHVRVRLGELPASS